MRNKLREGIPVLRVALYAAAACAMWGRESHRQRERRADSTSCCTWRRLRSLPLRWLAS